MLHSRMEALPVWASFNHHPQEPGHAMRVGLVCRVQMPLEVHPLAYMRVLWTDGMSRCSYKPLLLAHLGSAGFRVSRWDSGLIGSPTPQDKRLRGCKVRANSQDLTC